MRTSMSRTEFERKILHGLALEWENALYLLDSKYRKSIRLPAFSLKDMRRRLGYWSGDKNEICINREFALSRNWDSVRRILLHEMAHQLAEQVFGAQTETPHGPLFRKVCYLLRADYRASEEYMPDEGNSGMMGRIKKLFALAESSNRNEAESAMRKAHELAAKYNIEILARNTARNFISVFAGAPGLRHPREEYFLAQLLRDFYFVWTIWVPAYVIEKQKMGRVLELSGTPDNISIASYVYDFIRRYIDNRWTEYNSLNLLNRYRKTDFASGIVRGFASKLKSDRKIKSLPGSALIKVGDPLLKEYAQYRYPRTVSISRKGSSCSANILQDGINIGKELVISKGITKSGGSTRFLLECGD
ncbi:MAG: SprT-like domain-containing protein [Proteobacteria bacterium]|nr:SprT-like domain-containing protein [Pseudomonadota bacterium]MBU1398848.1 SprT-like domain-containing protein [Pseudomonadota bacterium]